MEIFEAKISRISYAGQGGYVIILMDFDTIIASIRMKGYCYLTLCFDERLILEHDVEEFI